MAVWPASGRAAGPTTRRAFWKLSVAAYSTIRRAGRSVALHTTARSAVTSPACSPKGEGRARSGLGEHASRAEARRDQGAASGERPRRTLAAAWRACAGHDDSLPRADPARRRTMLARQPERSAADEAAVAAADRHRRGARPAHPVRPGSSPPSDSWDRCARSPARRDAGCSRTCSGRRASTSRPSARTRWARSGSGAPRESPDSPRASGCSPSSRSRP
mgnify:CR=1 FL=1